MTNTISQIKAGGGNIIIKNVSADLDLFLKLHKTKAGEQYTHSRIGSKDKYPYCGSFVIPPAELSEFYPLYLAKISAGQEEYLVERQTESSHYIDLDFKYPVGTTEKQHTKEQTFAFIQKFLEICITKYSFNLEYGDTFTVFVMEKSKVNSNATWKVNDIDEPVVKDGIHIQFGFKIPKYIKKALWKDLISVLKNGFWEIPVINSWEDILDKGVFEGGTNNQLYGSIKAPGAARYNLINNYYYEVMQDKSFNISEPALMRICNESFHNLSTNNPDNVSPHWIESQVVEPVKVRVARATAIAGGAIGTDAVSVASSNAAIGESSPEHYHCVVDYIKEGLLAQYVQSGKYKEWVNIGYALYASFGKVRGKQLWDLLSVIRENDPTISNRPDPQWSRICENFSSIETGIFSIHSKAKETNMKKQRSIFVKHIGSTNNLYGSLWTSAMIADYFCSIHKEFIYNEDILYYFNGVFWDKCDKISSQLVSFIDKVFIPELREYGNNRLQYFQNKSEDALEEAEKQINSKNIELVLKFQGNVEGLREVKKRKSLIEDIKAFVAKANIEWDEKDTLFAFNNKIIDLTTGAVVEGNPNYYMTMTAGYDYDDSYPLEERKAELLKIIDDIFKDRKAVKDDFLLFLSTGLSGIKQQFISINTGEGANGKSFLGDLMLGTVGKYGKVLNPALFTKDLKDGANPEFADLHKKRYASTAEPNKGSKWFVSVVKPLTGEGAIQVRTGHDFSGKPCVLKSTLVAFTNAIPFFDDMEGYSIHRRLRMTGFERKYITQELYDEKVKEGIAEYYGVANKDYMTQEFINKYRQAFFHILLDYFIKYYNELNKNLPEQPAECKIIKADYFAGGDDMLVWIERYWEKCDKEENPPISLSDIFSKFESSAYYQQLPAKAKRNMSRKAFVDNLRKNANISDYVYMKGRSLKQKGKKSIQLKSECLVGWKERETDKITGLPKKQVEILFEEEEEKLVEVEDN